MESITKPQVIGKPFCDTGDKNTIPENATGSQLASLEEGFPPITALPVSSGGIPPEREDFNGAMNLNSQFYFAFQNGWWPTFDNDVSTAIGGYALGAVLWWFPVTGSFAGMAVPVKSLIANNTYNFNTNASYIGPYWKPLYKEPSAMAIGTVFFHQSSNAADVPGALPLFTGETISNADQLYPDFYSWVLSHTDLQISSSDYNTALTTYGECPKYVIDDTNKTIRLPKLGNYIKMANTTDGITQSDAGLPNVTGNGLFWESNANPEQLTGAFYMDSSTEKNKLGSNDSDYDNYAVAMDASRSSGVYGNSNTVTPAHTTVFPWVFAFNAAIPASTAQAAEFQAALSSKLDADFSNSTKPYVVSRTHSGTSYCTIWSDGYCEQSGITTAISANSSGTVTFTQAFANTDYVMQLTIKKSTLSVGGQGVLSYAATSASQATIHNGLDESYTISWEAKGYIS